MGFTLDKFIMDFAIMSGLMFISMILRVKIKFFQNYYIPVSLIAGLLGIIGGKYMLNILPFSDQAGAYSGYLFYFLFATLFIGNEGNKNGFKALFGRSGDSVCMNNGAYVGLYGVAAIISTTILIMLFPGLHDAFGLLAATGFAGGHGSAAAIGKSFAVNGWEEAISVGQTFATIGLLVGIFGGVALIKNATKRKYTQVIKEVGELPEDMRTGLIKPENRVPSGFETVNTMSIDTLTWHILLVFSSVGIGMAFNSMVMKKLIPGIYLPDHIFALVFGGILYSILKPVGLAEYVDKQTINRIGSCITDYLVGFGVAMINLQVVLNYWQAILLMSIIMIILNLILLYYFSRKYFNTYWFERGIYIFGMCTGVASIGVLLLRIVDPEYKTKALEDIGIAMIVMAPIDIIILSVTPVIFVQGLGLLWGIILTISAIILIGILHFVYKNERLKRKN